MDFTPLKETMTPGNLALYFYIDTRMEEGTVRVKCLSQQKMVMKTGKVFVVILGADPSQNQAKYKKWLWQNKFLFCGHFNLRRKRKQIAV